MSDYEVRILRWMTGNIRKDRVWNEEICLKIKSGPYWWKNERVTWDDLVMCREKQLNK